MVKITSPALLLSSILFNSFTYSSQGSQLPFYFTEAKPNNNNKNGLRLDRWATWDDGAESNLCCLSDRAALAAASLSAVWSHPKPTPLVSKKAGCPLMPDPPVPCHPKEGPAFAHAVSLMLALTGVYFPSEDPPFGAFSRRDYLTSGTHTVPSQYLLIAHDSFLVHYLSSEDACCNPCSGCSPDQAR